MLPVLFSTGSIFNQTSIMWTLAWSVVALYVVNGETNLKAWQKYALVILIDVVTFSADWSCIAVMAILSMYSNRGNLKKQIAGMSFWVLLYAVISFVFVNKTYGVITLAVILVYPLLRMYDGTKGKAGWMKWFFYLYYPLHLVMIGILRILMYGNTPLLFRAYLKTKYSCTISTKSKWKQDGQKQERTQQAYHSV